MAYQNDQLDEISAGKKADYINKASKDVNARMSGTAKTTSRYGPVQHGAKTKQRYGIIQKTLDKHEDVDMDEDEQLDEFKASGEDSEVMEPTSTSLKKRKADKSTGTGSAEKVSDGATKVGGDLINDVATKKSATRKADKSMGEAVAEIFGNEDLSEEFKEKATVIFEAVVHERVATEIAHLEEEFSSQLDEQAEIATRDLAKKVDSYLDYVTEQWVEDNKLAVDRGIRADIAESFILGLKELFSEHRIDVPEEEVDLVAEMAEQIEELQAKLNEEVNSTLEIRKELDEARKSDVFDEIAEGLADTQSEKLRSLTEGLEFVDLVDYSRKVNIIKDNYFGKTAIVEEFDGLDPVDTDVEGTKYIDPSIARYAASITKTFRNIN